MHTLINKKCRLIDADGVYVIQKVQGQNAYVKCIGVPKGSHIGRAWVPLTMIQR